MNVSSVKNLNGSVFSAVQDAELTEVVQTNSASWGASTIPTDLSANHITANSGFKIGNLAYGEYGLEGYGMDFDRTLGSITIMPNTAQGGGSNYGNINLTSKSGWGMGISTAECSINAFDWNKVNDASDTVVTNSATWGQGGAGDPEVESYVQTNSGAIDETVSTVGTNSGVWGGSALPVSAGQGVKINLVDNTLVFSNDETVLWSGTMTWGQNGSLSDSVKNYERIRFDIEETNRHRKSVNEMPLTDLSNANLREFSLNLLDATTSYFGNYFTVYQVNEAGTSITSVSGRQWWYNPWTSTAINGSTDRGLILKKVTGINKITGGN
jgi:hypothetical protein